MGRYIGLPHFSQAQRRPIDRPARTKRVKRVEIVSDRVSYIVLRRRWYNIIVLNVHAPSEEKIDE